MSVALLVATVGAIPVIVGSVAPPIDRVSLPPSLVSDNVIPEPATSLPFR